MQSVATTADLDYYTRAANDDCFYGGPRTRTKYTYDSNRNRTSETDALGNMVQFGYDPAGRLISQADANGNQTTWVRDIEGRVVSKTYPAGDTYRYTYDSAGRLLTRTDPLGQIKTIAYTIDDEPKGYNYANAVNATPAVTIAYDPLYPRPIIVQDGTGTTVLQYVPAGTLGAGQLAEQDSPDGGSAVIKSTYDVLGRISTQALGSATEMLTYDTIGRVSLDQSALGIFQYNYLGQTAQVTAEILQGNTWQSAYGYGTNAQDRQLQSIMHPSTTGASNISYTTGPENQILSRADAPSMQASPYDPIVSYVVDGDNRVQSANNVAWIYDANGNVLDDGTNTYQWDADNRLTFITNKSSGHVSQFKYDGFSRRTVIIEKANASATPVETHYLWCGSAPCESHTATGQQLALYFHQGEIAIGGNAPYYYARDSLGSVMQVVNANGALLGKAQYTNYGTVVLASGAVPTFGYAGMFQHVPSLTNLTLYRVYSPASERWLSRDPLEERGGRNLYAYVRSDPVSYTDPSGTSPVGVLIGGLLGGAYNVLANAGTIGEPGAPSVTTLFVAGTIGGIVGGAIDNPAVAAGVSGALTSGIAAYESGKSLSDSLIAAGASGLVNAVAGGIAGSVLGQLGANEVTQFVGGTAAGILGADIVNVIVPGAIAAPSNGNCR